MVTSLCLGRLQMHTQTTPDHLRDLQTTLLGPLPNLWPSVWWIAQGVVISGPQSLTDQRSAVHFTGGDQDSDLGRISWFWVCSSRGDWCSALSVSSSAAFQFPWSCAAAAAAACSRIRNTDCVYMHTNTYINPFHCWHMWTIIRLVFLGSLQKQGGRNQWGNSCKKSTHLH